MLLAGVVGAEGRVGLEARVSVQAVRGGTGGCQGPASPCFSLYSPSNSEGLLLLCSRTNGTTLARPSEAQGQVPVRQFILPGDWAGGLPHVRAWVRRKAALLV